MINWYAQEEAHADMLRERLAEVEQHRLVVLATSGRKYQPGIAGWVMLQLGLLLVSWGKRLQAPYLADECEPAF